MRKPSSPLASPKRLSMASLSWQAASAPRGPTASFENGARRPARAVAAAMAPSPPTGLPRTTPERSSQWRPWCPGAPAGGELGGAGAQRRPRAPARPRPPWGRRRRGTRGCAAWLRRRPRTAPATSACPPGTRGARASWRRRPPPTEAAARRQARPAGEGGPRVPYERLHRARVGDVARDPAAARRHAAAVPHQHREARLRERHAVLVAAPPDLGQRLSERDDADVVSQDSRSPSPCLLARESQRATGPTPRLASSVTTSPVSGPTCPTSLRLL